MASVRAGHAGQRPQMDQILIQRAQEYQSMNAVENMQSYEHVAKTHAQQLQKLVPAFRNFYKFGVRPAKRNRRPSIPGERFTYRNSLLDDRAAGQ